MTDDREIDKKHPLDVLGDGRDFEWATKERKDLIEQKNKCEENLASDIIKTSSAILLATPALYSFIANTEISNRDLNNLVIGMGIVSISLIMAMIFRSAASRAYTQRIDEIDKYYRREIESVSSSKHVVLRFSLDASLFAMIVGVTVIVYVMWSAL